VTDPTKPPGNLKCSCPLCLCECKAAYWLEKAHELHYSVQYSASSIDPTKPVNVTEAVAGRISTTVPGRSSEETVTLLCKRVSEGVEESSRKVGKCMPKFNSRAPDSKEMNVEFNLMEYLQTELTTFLSTRVFALRIT